MSKQKKGMLALHYQNTAAIQECNRINDAYLPCSQLAVRNASIPSTMCHAHPHRCPLVALRCAQSMEHEDCDRICICLYRDTHPPGACSQCAPTPCHLHTSKTLIDDALHMLGAVLHMLKSDLHMPGASLLSKSCGKATSMQPPMQYLAWLPRLYTNIPVSNRIYHMLWTSSCMPAKSTT